MTNPSSQGTVSQMAGIANQVGVESNSFLKKLAWLGAGLIFLFWTLFFLSKLACEYFLPKIRGKISPFQETDKANKDKAA